MRRRPRRLGRCTPRGTSGCSTTTALQAPLDWGWSAGTVHGHLVSPPASTCCPWRPRWGSRRRTDVVVSFNNRRHDHLLTPISAQLIRPLLMADHWPAVGGSAQVSQSGWYGAACSRCPDLPATASLIAFLNPGPQSDVMPEKQPRSHVPCLYVVTICHS